MGVCNLVRSMLVYMLGCIQIDMVGCILYYMVDCILNCMVDCILNCMVDCILNCMVGCIQVDTVGYILVDNYHSPKFQEETWNEEEYCECNIVKMLITLMRLCHAFLLGYTSSDPALC